MKDDAILGIGDVIGDFERYAPLLLIKHKTTRRLISFHPDMWNPGQRKLHDRIEQMRRDGELLWLIVLKARQEGVSTYSEARIFHSTVTNPNTNSLILADSAEKAAYVFDMCRTMYEKLPDYMRPAKRYLSKDEGLVFDTPDGKGLKSSISIATALGDSPGQSMTIHQAHVTEAASFRDFDRLFSVFIPSIPHIPGALVLVETTAKGAGTQFHAEWKKAKDGESIFKPLFLSWLDMPSYSHPIFPEDDMSPENEEEARLYAGGATQGQVKWCRFMIHKAFRGNVDNFNEQYPDTDEKAFIVSGSTVFDRYRLMKAYGGCSEPKDKREVLVREKKGWNDVIWATQERKDGRLWIWKHPEKGRSYRIGADVSEGVGKDYSALGVFDEKGMEQVAEWRSNRISAIDFAMTVVGVARYYSDAKIVIETNNHGHSTQAEARRLYWNFYRHTHVDRFANIETDKLGWQTTPSSKPLLTGYMTHCVAEGNWKLNSKRLLEEMMVFMDDGKSGSAAAGHHDDLLMAAMMAMYTAYQDGTIYDFGDGASQKLDDMDANVYYPYDPGVASGEIFEEREDEEWMNF
jgi:hypothetical protein